MYQKLYFLFGGKFEILKQFLAGNFYAHVPEEHEALCNDSRFFLYYPVKYTDFFGWVVVTPGVDGLVDDISLRGLS